MTIANAQATMTAPTGIRWARLPSRRPTTAVIRNPISGRNRTAWIRPSISRGSLAHRVVLVDERRPLVAEDRDDDREADGRLGGGDGHDHERDHGAVRAERRHERAERDDRKVDRVEHQLDRHQHADRVAPGEEPEHPDPEQDRRDDEVGVERVRAAGEEADRAEGHRERDEEERSDEDADHRLSSEPRSRLGRNTPPITAASRCTPTISNGSTQSANSTRASSVVSMWRASATSPQSVARIASTDTRTSSTAAIAAGTAWVWKTSRDGASLVSVSMIANRIRTLIAPM